MVDLAGGGGAGINRAAAAVKAGWRGGCGGTNGAAAAEKAGR